MSTMERLARVILAFDARSIAPDAIRQAKLLLLDAIGCAIAGAREPVAGALADIAGGGLAECILIGRSAKTDVLNAILVNGAAVRALDFNDYLINESKDGFESGGHPSDNIPVALAVGRQRKSSGAEILAAIVIGYELYARLQMLMERSGTWDGVTASGIVAPAMAGHLMGLDPVRLANGLALGLARAATPSIVRRGNMSAAKSIANALVAQSGVQAAYLAEQGITGPLGILDDAYGLRDIFRNGDLSLLTEPIPSRGAVMRAHVKTYPCINTGQSAAAAALQLHKSLKDRSDRVSRIEITMADYPVVHRQQADEARARPQSRESADHSFPFIVAVALIDGAFTAAQYDHERWRDPRVVALLSKMIMRRDAGWNARAPGSFPCALTAWDSMGREYLAEVPYPPGFSKDALDESIVIEKFHGMTASIIGDAKREAIVDAALKFDDIPTTAPLDAAMGSIT